MREVLFRGIITGSYNGRSDGKWAHGFYERRNTIDLIHNGQVTWRIKPETVGEYTGLKDKNGVEIFEGDIVAVMNHMGVSNHEVEDIFNFAIWYDYTIAKSPSSLEVIGNIHDNPEFLEHNNRITEVNK